MERFAAHYLYFGGGILKKNHMVSVGQEGKIMETGNFDSERQSTIFYNGIICAAFSISNENESEPFPEKAYGWLRDKLDEYPNMNIPECLKQFAIVPALIRGNKISLWCIENPDFKTLRLCENSSIRAIYP